MDFVEAQSKSSKNMVGLGAVVVLHVFLGWALASGLARKVVEVIKDPIETKLIEEVQPPPPPPPPENLPPPPPKALPPPPVYVPPPEISVAPQPQAPTITTTQEVPPPRPPAVAVPTAPPAPPAPPAAPRGMKPAIGDIKGCSPTGEDYPVAARRAEATGITKVRFTVDENGNLAKAEVVRSSGFSREHKQLDRITIAKLSECKFKAGTDAEGRPAGGTFEAEYVWKLD